MDQNLAIEQAYRLADELMDIDERQTAMLLNRCAGTAEVFQRVIKDLSYVVLEKNAKKRRSELERIKAELNRQGFDTGAMFPLSLMEQLT